MDTTFTNLTPYDTNDDNFDFHWEKTSLGSSRFFCQGQFALCNGNNLILSFEELFVSAIFKEISDWAVFEEIFFSAIFEEIFFFAIFEDIFVFAIF